MQHLNWGNIGALRGESNPSNPFKPRETCLSLSWELLVIPDTKTRARNSTKRKDGLEKDDRVSVESQVSFHALALCVCVCCPIDRQAQTGSNIKAKPTNRRTHLRARREKQKERSRQTELKDENSARARKKKVFQVGAIRRGRKSNGV